MCGGAHAHTPQGDTEACPLVAAYPGGCGGRLTCGRLTPSGDRPPTYQAPPEPNDKPPASATPAPHLQVPGPARLRHARPASPPARTWQRGGSGSRRGCGTGPGAPGRCHRIARRIAGTDASAWVCRCRGAVRSSSTSPVSAIRPRYVTAAGRRCATPVQIVRHHQPGQARFGALAEQQGDGLARTEASSRSAGRRVARGGPRGVRPCSAAVTACSSRPRPPRPHARRLPDGPGRRRPPAAHRMTP